MEAEATIRWQGPEGVWTKLTAELSPLEAAQFAGSKFGFYDLDVDADDRGVRITAAAKDRKVIAKGKSLTLAVENLLGIFTDE